MTPYLKEQTKLFSKAAKRLKKNIVVKSSVQESMVMLLDEDRRRVVALFDVSEASKHPEIKSFTINPNGWVWAEDEGFTVQEMYEKLGDKVFKEIPYVGVLAYLLR